MNIAQIRQLDIGMKNITCSGEVTWAGQQKNIKGTTTGGKDYDFWSQFIVVKDETDKIGVSITLETDESGAKKGDKVAIEKAELIQYQDKNDELQLKLQGKIVSARSQNSPQSPQESAQAMNYQPPNPQGKKEPITENDAHKMVRDNVTCSFIQSGELKLDDLSIEVTTAINKWVSFILTNNNPDYVGDNPPPTGDSEIPF